VEKGAIVDKKNMYGCRALSYAFLNNHLDVARLLLERGADPNVRPYDTNKFCCPIFFALVNEPEACELLLKFGANLDQKASNGMTPLQIAIKKNNTKVIKVLQTATDKKKEEKRKEIIANIAKAKSNEVAPILPPAAASAIPSREEDMKKSSELLLYEAAGAGNLNEFQRIESMQRDEFDINWNDNVHEETYLMIGSINGDMDVASYILEKGAIVDQKNKYGCTALCYALKGEHLDVSRLLLERGADPNVQPYDTEYASLLYVAAQENQPEMCELLLSFGANLDQKFSGVTALQAAIHQKHTEVIKILQTATDKKKPEHAIEQKRISDVAKAAAANKIAAELLADLDIEANETKAADNKKDKK